ncbi:MAG: hypothetical protein AB8G05_00640 [Oligoflexales bacterium]
MNSSKVQHIEWAPIAQDTSTLKHFCFLTRVTIEQLGSGSNKGRCEVKLKLEGGFWLVGAGLQESADPTAICAARCIRWNK